MANGTNPFSNPWTQMGIGLLGAAQSPRPWQSAFQNLGQMQEMQQQLAIHQARQEVLQRQKAQEAQRQQFFQQQQESLMGAGPPTPIQQQQLQRVRGMQAGLGPEEMAMLEPPDQISARRKQIIPLGGTSYLDLASGQVVQGPGAPSTRAPQSRTRMTPDGLVQEEWDSENKSWRQIGYQPYGAQQAAKVQATEASKPLSRPIIKEIQGVRQGAEAINRLETGFKPEFGGKGAFGGVGAELQMEAAGRFGLDKDAVDWWKSYASQIQLVERHEKFGATLTANELAAWRAADIHPGLDPDTIARNLAIRSNLAEKFRQRISEDYKAAGYPDSKVDSIAKPNYAPNPKQPGPTIERAEQLKQQGRFVVRQGKDRTTGRRVVQYSDGSVEYAE